MIKYCKIIILFIAVLLLNSCNKKHDLELSYIKEPVKNSNYFPSLSARGINNSDSFLIIRKEYELLDSNKITRIETVCLDKNLKIIWEKYSNNTEKHPTFIPLDLNNNLLLAIEAPNYPYIVDTFIYDIHSGQKLVDERFTRGEINFTFSKNQSNEMEFHSLSDKVYPIIKKELEGLKWEEKIEINRGSGLINKELEGSILFASEDSIQCLSEVGRNWLLETPFSYSSAISVDSANSLVYILQSSLFCINMNSGEMIFRKNINYRSVTESTPYLSLKKRIYKDFIIAADYKDIGIYNRFNGDVVATINFLEKYDMDIADVTVFSDHLIVLTDKPTSVIKISLEQLINE